MISFEVVHTCGHKSIQHCDTDAQLAQREALLLTLPCEGCNQSQRLAEQAVQREELGLPELLGEDDDLVWAETIRVKAVTANHDYYQALLEENPFPDNEDLHNATIGAAERALHDLQNIRDARWWVENREMAMEYTKYRIAQAIRPLLEGATRSA